MAQPGAFVPAWKRLGLKLKSAEDPQPNHPSTTVLHQQHGNGSAREASPLEPDTSAGHTPQNSSSLGKRKHHSHAVDNEGESVKKTKYGQENGLFDGHAAAAPGPEFDSPKPAQSEAPSADRAPTKGDSNYRKKKGGDTNYRKKKEPTHAKAASKQSHPLVTDSRLAAPTSIRTPSLSPGRADLLPSTEIDHHAPAFLATPQRQLGPSLKDSSSSLSPPKTDRRKSVTFTPDTKTSDGNSASNLFKKWVAEQKGSDADFTPAEVSQFTEPPKVHIANSNPPTSQTPKGTLPSKGKKDPSRYLNYLHQYHQDRSNWKFNKATQNDILDNALNIFRIPDTYSDALLEYISGLQGVGIINRLRDRWSKAIIEIDEAERKDPMDEREALKEAALQERLAKERRRRQLEGDVVNMVGHPYSEGYIRRLKRSRAEALCSALKMAMPTTTTTPQSGLRQVTQQELSEPARSVPQTTARKRKRRTGMSSDESSDSSSSEEESSSEESSEESSEDEISSASTSSEGEDSSDADSDTDSSDGSGGRTASQDDSD